MSSWVYGDPAPPIPRAYAGDPAKIRLIHGGVKETHVFHLHNHQWRLEGENPTSTILDSISISPQECYTLDILHGAGSLNRTIGDVIFHCHLYPHFHEGMWTLWRIHDRLEDGTGHLPDDTPIPPLCPLADRVPPPKKDALHPGYPGFIRGRAGEAPLQPPCGILDADGENVVEPSLMEMANFVEKARPGALYAETCPCHTDECETEDHPCHEKEQNPEEPTCHDGKCPPDGCPKIFEMAMVRITDPYQAGDYLYYYGGIDDAWLGLWGILRAYDRVQDCLKPLCKEKERILPLPPCPGKEDVVRRYEVAAVQRNIEYNRYGDHDPDGLIFVPLEEAEQAMCGKYRPRPLILRANAGDWIEVTLHNLFDPGRPVPYLDYPKVPLEERHIPSMRVSLNPQLLQYDPVKDSGINVGYNHHEQTVGPGESKRYLWRADREYGACLIQSFGDMRNHRYHGLFGAVIVEPPGADWYRNLTLRKGIYQEQAVVTAPGVETFREYVLFIQNGIRLLDRTGALIQTARGEPEAGEESEPVDAEDTGEKGYNYRSERFANRLEHDSRISKVFDSRVHGDPATPVFRAYAGDRVIFRTLMPADKPRNVSLAIHGHLWREQLQDPFYRVIPVQGAVSVGSRYDMELKQGASCPGDYLYRSGSLKWDVESGMWGILRVMKQGIGCRCRSVCRRALMCLQKKTD